MYKQHKIARYQLVRECSKTPTCRLFRGSIFMTGPRVLRGRETSMLWFGIRGVWMASGVLGMTPKLEERTTRFYGLIRRQRVTRTKSTAGLRWLLFHLKETQFFANVK